MTRTEQKYRKAINQFANLQGTLVALRNGADNEEEADAISTILSAVSFVKFDLYDAAKAGGRSVHNILS